MIDYLYKAALIWFIGFFPFFELFIAIPAGVSLKLDPVSTVLFCVAGNFFPVLLIEYGYTRLARYPGIREWLNNRVSDKLCQKINQRGIWYVFVITPWVGVWAMAVTAKLLRMEGKTFAWGAFASILAYSAVLVIMIRAGLGFFGG